MIAIRPYNLPTGDGLFSEQRRCPAGAPPRDENDCVLPLCPATVPPTRRTWHPVDARVPFGRAVVGPSNQPPMPLFRTVVPRRRTTIHPWGGYYGATGHETGRLRTDIGAVCSTIRINSGTGPFTMKLERRYEWHSCETTRMRARGCDCARPRNADAGNGAEIRQPRYRPRTSA